MLKKIYLSDSTKIFLGVIHNHSVIIIKKSFKETCYLQIPKNIFIRREKDFLVVYTKNVCLNFFSLFYFKLSALLFVKSIIKKKLILKGVGYRMSITSDLKVIVFKLGYSHTIFLNIPSEIFSVSIIKNLISIQSYDTVFLGDFISQIRNLRIPDSYKSKGFLRKNEKLTLKQLKKK